MEYENTKYMCHLPDETVEEVEDFQQMLRMKGFIDCINMRSKAKYDEWQKKLKCKQIILDGSADVEDNFEVIKPYL